MPPRPDVTVKVEGARQLRSALKRAGAELGELTDAHREAAALVASAAAARAPQRTGRLAASIRPNASRTRARVAAGGAATPYAGPIHWGWPARNIAESLFVTEAAAELEETWLSRYEAELERIVGKVNDAT